MVQGLGCAIAGRPRLAAVQDIPNLGRRAGKALDSPALRMGLYGLAFSRIARRGATDSAVARQGSPNDVGRLKAKPHQALPVEP